MPQKKHNVYIVTHNTELNKTFEEYGYTIVHSGRMADMIVFNRSQNVMPGMYGHDFGVSSVTNKANDYKERDIWKHWVLKKGKPVVGIGNGSHMVHVLNGGTLFQKVTNHLDDHEVMHINEEGDLVDILSTTSNHTQSMKQDIDLIPILYAPKLSEINTQFFEKKVVNLNGLDDLEAAWYPETKSIAWQPEIQKNRNQKDFKKSTDLFFITIERLLLG